MVEGRMNVNVKNIFPGEESVFAAVLTHLQQGKRVLVTGELGNGKTHFAKEIQRRQPGIKVLDPCDFGPIEDFSKVLPEWTEGVLVALPSLVNTIPDLTDTLIVQLERHGGQLQKIDGKYHTEYMENATLRFM